MTAVDTRRCAYGCDHLAAPGSNVCPRCETFTRRTLADLAQTYDDLIDPRLLQLPGRSGGDKPPMVGDRVVEGRAKIRGVLVVWCKLLEDEHAITLPADSVGDMAAHVLRHHLRLLAGDAAEALVTDCADLARITAWPKRATGVWVACPSCAQPVLVDPTADEVRCRTPECPEFGVPQWWIERLLPETGQLMNAVDAAAWVRRTIPWLTVEAATLTKWVQRDILAPATYGGQGVETMFDPVLVVEAALMMRDRRVA